MCTTTGAPPAPLTLACGSGTGEIGVPLSITLARSGGQAPFTYSLVSGSLPAGVSLNTSTGVISGTPTSAGSFNYTAKVVDGLGHNVTTSTCNITVVLGLTLSGGSGSGEVGVPLSVSLSVIGGWGQSAFSIASGSLPPGMSMNPLTGVISGTPTTAGTYNYTAQAVDTLGKVATTSCTVTIANAVALSCGSGTGTVGVALSIPLTVSGGVGPFTYSIVTGSLPPGVTLNSSTGVISGTPTTAGTYNYTARVQDALGKTAVTSGCTISIASAMSLFCGSGSGTVGMAFSVTLFASGGQPPRTYSLISGSLPPGTTLNSTTGNISGTPTTAGTYLYTAQVQDSYGNVATSAGCTIVIAPVPTLACGSGTGTVGVSLTVPLTATGLAPLTYSVVSGSLPPGMALNASTGVISGIPTGSGTYDYAPRVTDSLGNNATTLCRITIVPALTLACGSGNINLGTSWNVALSAFGGQGPFTYSILTGSIPTGMTFNTSTGVISGTPTVQGTFNYTARVQDSLGNVATSPGCTIVVGAAIPHPVAYWAFDSTSGTTAVDSISPGPNNLASVGDTPNWQPLAGPFGENCVLFPLSGSGGGFFKSGGMTGLPVYNRNPGFTVVVWYKAAQDGVGFDQGWWYAEFSTDKSTFWGIHCNGTVTPHILYHPGGANPEIDIIFSTQDIFHLGWHMLAVVDDGSTSKAYFDGNLVGSGATSANVPNLAMVTIGCTGATVGLSCVSQLYGYLDEIRVYAQPLSLAQIQSLYNSNHP